MWTCPNCNRPFQTTNQWHICGEKTIDDIFEGKTDKQGRHFFQQTGLAHRPPNDQSA